MTLTLAPTLTLTLTLNLALTPNPNSNPEPNPDPNPDPNPNPAPDPNPNPNPNPNPDQACRQCVTPPHFHFTLDQRGPYKGLCCFYPAGATGCDASYDNACQSFGAPFELQPEPQP